MARTPVADTIYATVATAHGHDIVDVFDGATCDATTTTGCNQKPGQLKLGTSGGGLGESSLYRAVNPKTNTLYATHVVWAAADAHTVYVLDGATCDPADHAGCGQKPATITVGDDPRAPAVDHGGCRQSPVEDAVGNYPFAIAVDPGAGTAYVVNSDNTVSVVPVGR